MRISEPGRYFTKDGRIATITRISDGRAFGNIPGHYDRTWWNAPNGEHALCPVDDLVRRLEDGGTR